MWKSSKSGPDLGEKVTMTEHIIDYFKTGRDAGIITWAHAVNNKKTMEKHLKST